MDFLTKAFVIAQAGFGEAAPMAPPGEAAGSSALHSGCGAAQGGTLSMVVWLVLLFALMYFMLIRPQKKQRDAHQKLLSSIKKGDRVVTSGGILGTIVGMTDSSVILDTFEGTKVRVQKAHVSGLQTETTKAGAEAPK